MIHMGFSNFPVNVSLKPINFFLSFMRRCEDMGWVLVWQEVRSTKELLATLEVRSTSDVFFVSMFCFVARWGSRSCWVPLKWIQISLSGFIHFSSFFNVFRTNMWSKESQSDSIKVDMWGISTEFQDFHSSLMVTIWKLWQDVVHLGEVIWLVVWNIFFSHILNIIIPID